MPKTATIVSKTINITIPVNREHLHKLCTDMLTTCYEGGSAYWLACNSVVRDNDGNVKHIIGCHDREDESTKWGEADAVIIQSGVERIVEGTVKVRDDIRMNVIQALVDPDSTSWDAEVADCVLQAGLLNDIVYG